MAKAGGPPSNPNAQPAASAIASYKVQKDLKPDTLKKDFTPVERTVWTKAFRHFFRASNMHLATASEQQANLNLCVEPSISLQIDPIVTEDTPVYLAEGDNPGRKSCMEVIDDIFLHQHPILRRRCDFLNLRQSPGELMSDFIVRMRSLADECNLKEVKLEDFLIMMTMVGTHEEDLRSALYRLRTPTWTQVYDVTHDYERGNNQSKAKVSAHLVRDRGGQSQRNTPVPESVGDNPVDLCPLVRREKDETDVDEKKQDGEKQDEDQGREAHEQALSTAAGAVLTIFCWSVEFPGVAHQRRRKWGLSLLISKRKH